MTAIVLHAVEAEDGEPLGAEELGRALGRGPAWVVELVEVGILEPLPGAEDLRFEPAALFIARRVSRLQADLGVNLDGAALALELLRRIDALEAALVRAGAGRD